MGRFMIPCCCICGISSEKWHDDKWENEGGLQDFCPQCAKLINNLKEYTIYNDYKREVNRERLYE